MSFDKRENAKTYTPQDGDTLQAIAERETAEGNEITWQEIAKFNWGTDDEDEVNEYMRDELGCHARDDANNFAISSDDEPRSDLLIPVPFEKNGLALGTTHTVRIRKKESPPQFLECASIPGVTFEFNKSFVRPSVVDSIGDLEEPIKNHPDAKIMIFGHTDTSGSDSYNKALSERRAESIYAFITDDADTWESLYNQENWGMSVLQQILQDFGGPYDPGRTDGVQDARTTQAIRQYQGDRGLTVDGVAGPDTRREMFTEYMTDKHDVELVPDKFMDPKHMGCGEFNSIDPVDGPHEPNRRVTFFLFDEGRLPNLPCKEGDITPCQKQMTPPLPRFKESFRCSFYDSLAKKCPCEGGALGEPEIRVYLQLLFKDTDNSERIFPKDFPVTFTFEDGTQQNVKLDENGMIVDGDNAKGLKFNRSKKAFTLSFKQPKRVFVVCEKPGEANKTQQRVEEDNPDNDSSQLGQLMSQGNRAFQLPKDDWTLTNSDWTVTPRGSYDTNDRKFKNLEDTSVTVGSEDSPVKLVLDTHWQYSRFEYFDRHYGHSDHSGNRIGIPPVLLKGVRSSPDGSSTDYDTISNWTINNDDPATACQCLPWIISREDNGTPLPKLDKDMLLVFGKEDTYVVSNSATEREIQELDPTTDADKLKPGADRLKIYDLPELWKSKNYYTRLSGGTGKFFGDLTEADIESANDSSKPLTFSLDDIVLVAANGSQVIRDKDENDSAQDLSEHSRVTLLYLDHGDDFKVTIFREKADAQYHSDLEFRQNVIVEYHPSTRAVMFCSDFYDVYDKRTRQVGDFDFAKKHILGARAAMIDDSDISDTNVFDSASDVTNAYVHRIRNYGLHYLHLGAVDGTRVVSALVTHWSGRFTINAGLGGTATDKTNYETMGMNNAMQRWNRKDYQLERLSGSEDTRIKTFCLFEAKQDIGGVKRGGKHNCTVDLTDNNQGSQIGLENCRFRSSAYAEEGRGWGTTPTSHPDPLSSVPDYDGSTTERLVAAHELGHASGLYDDYAYYARTPSDQSLVPLLRYNQRYPGMPYITDRLSIMNKNHAPRMRNYWGRTNWINDAAKAGQPLNSLLNDTVFKVTFSGLEFELTDAKYRNIYKAAYDDLNHSFGGSSTDDLLLYKLGDDELAHDITAGQIYRGILVVKTCISATFINGSSGTPAADNWTDNQKRQWLRALGSDLRSMLDNKYRLQCTDASNDFANTYLKFTPHCEVPAGAASAGTHFTIEVTKDGSADFATTGSTIEVGNNCNNTKIIRYFFGKDDTVADLVKADLTTIRDWIAGASVANGTFSIEDI